MICQSGHLRLIFQLYITLTIVVPLRMVFGASEVPYHVTIEGISSQEMHETLQEVSDTFRLEKRPPASISLLQRRIKRDIPWLLMVLKSYGFYGGTVKTLIDDNANPVRVTFTVESGPPYLLQSFEVHTSEAAQQSLTKLPEAPELGLTIGDPAKSTDVLEAEKKLIAWLRRRGYPFPEIAERKVIVDHATRGVSVAFSADPGHPATFGPTEMNGLISVDEHLIRTKIPWKEGDPFQPDLLEKAQKTLSATGFFSTVEIRPAEFLNDERELPVIITVKERKHRTIKAGVSYATDEGVGGRVSWEHRNLLQQGERVNTGMSVSDIAYAIDGSFRRPGFFRANQDLLLNARVAEDRPDAFTSQNISTSLLIERILGQGMKLSGGLRFKASHIDQLGDQERFGLLSLPSEFTRDTSDQLLDPTEGSRLSLQFAPFYDTLRADMGFLKGYVSYSRYFQLPINPSFVLATRSACGMIAGSDRSTIPADERFYAGGGGSIRGYEYQSVGQLRENDPLGGRSLLEVSLEIRMKLNDTLGFVTFIDGGSAFTSTIPDFHEAVRWGIGGGVRYFTPVGPLRFDVGVPLNRRSGTDDSFQIYVSIGQAF